MKNRTIIPAGPTGTQPSAVTQRMNQGISQHKAIATSGLPTPPAKSTRVR